MVFAVVLSNAATASPSCPAFPPNTALPGSLEGGNTTAPISDLPVADGFPKVCRNSEGSHWLYPSSDRENYDGIGNSLPPVSDVDSWSNWLVGSNSARLGIETDLNFIFIDRSTDMVWPAPGKAVILRPDNNAIRIACKLGERVCYSIYTKNGVQSWGLQPNSSCYQCCAICGDGGANMPIMGLR